MGLTLNEYTLYWQWPIRKSINNKESHRIFKPIVVVYHIQNYLRFAQDNFFDNVMIYYEHVQ